MTSRRKSARPSPSATTSSTMIMSASCSTLSTTGAKPTSLISSRTLSETGTRKGTLAPAQLKGGQLDPGRMVNEPIHLDPGLTGKYTITPNVPLDFALNPDFAQIESDQLVVTANQRFPIFF